MLKYLCCLFILLFVFNISKAHNSEDTVSDSLNYKSFIHSNKGFEFQDQSGNNLLQIEFRGQFRVAYPTDSDPITYDQYQNEQIYFGVNRARVKIGGHSYKPWLKYYLEYELFSSNLLDFRLMFEKKPWLKVKIGQWKVQYNRERIISSGKQQTMERSILTRAFTVDRQQGLSIYGHLEGSGMANFNYWLSVFMGTGRGAQVNDDEHLMYMSRLQWNIFGEPIKFSGTDIEFHSKPSILIAVAAVTNQSQYTSFSQNGGGQLEGFKDGIAGQYRVNQFMQESALKYKGFSWQQELHFKQIEDNINHATTEMAGNVSQAGYLLKDGWLFIPKNIEIYGRYAFYFPDRTISSELNEEYSLGINWFISAHRFKFTGETSYLSSKTELNQNMNSWRYRLQLDISF